MKRFLEDNGLSLVLFALFFLFLGGQAVTGWSEYNSEQRQHGSEEVAFGAYLTTGHFGEGCSRTGRASSSRCRPTCC